MRNEEILLKTIQKENKILIENYNQLKKKYEQEIKVNKEIIEEKKNILEEKNNIQEQLDSILYSRSYKAIKRIKKILGR